MDYEPSLALGHYRKAMNPHHLRQRPKLLQHALLLLAYHPSLPPISHNHLEVQERITFLRGWTGSRSNMFHVFLTFFPRIQMITFGLFLCVGPGASQASIMSYDKRRNSLSLRWSSIWAETERARKQQYSNRLRAYLSASFAEAGASFSNCSCKSSGRTNSTLPYQVQIP